MNRRVAMAILFVAVSCSPFAWSDLVLQPNIVAITVNNPAIKLVVQSSDDSKTIKQMLLTYDGHEIVIPRGYYKDLIYPMMNTIEISQFLGEPPDFTICFQVAMLNESENRNDIEHPEYKVNILFNREQVLEGSIQVMHSNGCRDFCKLEP